MELRSRRAIVTGGASGIGEATARLFAAHGAQVMIADIDEERGQQVARDIGPQAAFHATDVSRSDQVAALVARVTSLWNGVDLLFNSAAIVVDGYAIQDFPEDAFDRTMEVNVKGAFLTIRYCLPHMIAAGTGAIINMSSTTGMAGYTGQCAYGTSKAAIIQLTRNAAVEVASHGIRVNAICAGGVLSPLVFARRPDASPEEVIEHFSNTNPMKRPGRAQEIAAAALWLAGEGSSFVTGQAIVVDGGRTASIYRGPTPSSFGPHDARPAT